jgi:hypothetical protein
MIPVGTNLPNGPFPAPKTSGVTPDPTSLPVQLDAAGAFTYTVGASAAVTNGIVEVSLDDPAFNSPRVASFSSDLGAAKWQLPLSAAELTPGTHTVYARQRINGRGPSPVVSVTYTVSATIEQVVTSMVTLITANPRSSLGVSSYDLSLKNTSSVNILAPVRLQVASITSASGTVTVANADSGGTGTGAVWDYSSKLGADNALTANETSAARNLRFNNPRNEAFTVTFTVIGNLDRASAGGSSGSSSSGGSGGSGSGDSQTTAVTNLVFQITYNPLLNTLQVLKQ